MRWVTFPHLFYRFLEGWGSEAPRKSLCLPRPATAGFRWGVSLRSHRPARGKRCSTWVDPALLRGRSNMTSSGFEHGTPWFQQWDDKTWILRYSIFRQTHLQKNVATLSKQFNTIYFLHSLTFGMEPQRLGTSYFPVFFATRCLCPLSVVMLDRCRHIFNLQWICSRPVCRPICPSLIRTTIIFLASLLYWFWSTCCAHALETNPEMHVPQMTSNDKYKNP